MNRIGRTALLAVASIVVLLVLLIVALPLFLNTDSFRTRIEATLTKSLGRKVTLGKVDLALWSGSLVASQVAVADDPTFSPQPFIQASTLKIGVQLFPLLLHRQVLVRSFDLESPRIQLLRNPAGTWNYATIGSAAATAQHDQDTRDTFPDLTIGIIEINDGQITVGPATTAAANPSIAATHTYEKVSLSVKDFALGTSFPFKTSASLPANGGFTLSGNAGPINQQDASATPFAGHLDLKHIDPLAAGLVDPSDGISGLVEGLTLDAQWSGQQLHITKLLVDSPHLTLLRSATPAPAKPSTAPNTTLLRNLAIDDAKVQNGAITLATAAPTATAPPAVYQQLNAQITNFTANSVSPFSLSAQLPNGGVLNASGKAGPYTPQDALATPLDAHVKLTRFELASAGLLPPDAGVSGVADLDAQFRSNGGLLNASGTVQVAGIKLARDGQPSSKPVQLDFNVNQNQHTSSGTIQQAVFRVGAAVIQIAGSFASGGTSGASGSGSPGTTLDLKVTGNAIPIDELEAFLPALGISLPSGSRLTGGTATTTLAVRGPAAKPSLSGPVQVANTQLAGFNLGQKLQGLTQLTGGKVASSTGSGTTIRSLSMVIEEQGGSIRTDHIALDIAGVGTATGAGSVQSGGALNYNMLLKPTALLGSGSASPAPTPGRTTPSSNSGSSGGLGGITGALSGLVPGGGGALGGSGARGGGALGGGGAAALAGGALGGGNPLAAGGLTGGLAAVALRQGIPVAIAGTTSNPTFAPDLTKLAGGAAAGALKNLVPTKSKSSPAPANPLGKALGGLLGPH